MEVKIFVENVDAGCPAGADAGQQGSLGHIEGLFGLRHVVDDAGERLDCLLGFLVLCGDESVEHVVTILVAKVAEVGGR